MLKLVRPILIILFFMLTVVSAKSQKWQPGYVTDIKDNRLTGLINAFPSGKGPVKNEAFIIYKENKDAAEIKLSTSDIKHFIIGKDSFIVAHPPTDQNWANEFDFVKVVLDEPLKLYVYKGGNGRGGGRGVHISPGLGLGIGGGSYGGSYVGGGLGVSFGGGGGNKKRISYYFGANTAELTELNPQNFEDVMIEIMGDEPEVTDRIREHQFGMGNIDKLVNYFNQVQASHTQN